MKRIVSVVLSMLIVYGASSQEKRKDKAQFVTSENEYWESIKKSIDEYEKKSQPNKERSFKMDYTGVDLPKDVKEFTTVWCNPPISQGSTGTCWCFSTSSFYESEIFRLTKQQIKISEMYTVYWEYVEKAREYIKTRGSSFFGEGSETNAVARMMKMYGMVPAEAYTAMKAGQPFHKHDDMYSEMKTYLESLKRDNGWNEEEGIKTIKSILNFYLGEPPTKITVQGTEMTPLEYMKNIAKINPDDYVNVMSLMEKPYWMQVEYDVPDNWWNSDDYYNVPLDVFMDALKKATKDGYGISIGGDVSETGYSAMNDVAMVPTYDIPSEYIDENARQMRFSNGATTDDHAIHLIGYLYKEKDFWFVIKDSGSGSRDGKNKGYYFFHEDYVKLKMMTYTVHKDALKEVLKKFNK